MPLDIALDRVRTLLVSLILQPRKQTTRTLTRLCHRVLVRQGDGWRCAVALESDGRFPASELASPIFTDERVTRVRLFLDTGPDTGAAVALLEREGDDMVQFRPLRTRPLAVSWNDDVRVRLQCDGQERGTLILPGGDPLTDAPWVMEADDQNAGAQGTVSCLRIVGTGSRRTRSGSTAKYNSGSRVRLLPVPTIRKHETVP